MDQYDEARAKEFFLKINKAGPLPDQSIKAYKGLENCWEWTAGKERQGYGCFWFRRKQTKTHRVSWILHQGEIPSGLYVLHKCDNRCCVNPSHLFLGTVHDNIADRHSKGRNGAATGNRNGHYTKPESTLRGDKHPSRTKPWTRPRGSAHGISKLMESQVVELRRIYGLGGQTYKGLSRQFGISPAMVKHIIKRTYWKHV